MDDKNDLGDILKNVNDERIKKSKNPNKPLEVDLKGFESILEDAKQGNYNSTEVILVDKDIHYVFTLLKKYKKINISQLVNYSLEKFLESHKNDIKDVIKKNKNKYL